MMRRFNVKATDNPSAHFRNREGVSQKIASQDETNLELGGIVP
jgi:hypothetical protein